jgi:hypothetical protein
MFSYVDLVRIEIALEVGERFGVTIPDEETDGWRTLGDVARLVVQRAGAATTEREVFDWVRALIADGYGVAAALMPDEEVFGDYDRMTSWFMAPLPPSPPRPLVYEEAGRAPRRLGRTRHSSRRAHLVFVE